MIKQHHPCLNRTYNENASALPEKYTGPANTKSIFGTLKPGLTDHLY
jgi:hypothetical protein